MEREVKVTENDGKTIKINVEAEGDQREENKGSSLEEHAPSDLISVSETEASKGGEAEEREEVDPLEQATKEAKENRDRWMRAVAELENFRKRTAHERSRLQKYRHEELLRDLLPVVDNIERAVHHSSETGESDGLVEGIHMIVGMFRDVLDRYGVKEIKALGEPFDPSFHEAIARVPSPDTSPNTVVEQMEKGYMYHDRLLRPARVVVSANEES